MAIAEQENLNSPKIVGRHAATLRRWRAVRRSRKVHFPLAVRSSAASASARMRGSNLSPQIGTAGNLRHVRTGRQNCRDQFALLLIGPYAPPLRPRNYCDLDHRTVPCTGANTGARTGAISKYQPITARRPSPERYPCPLAFAVVSRSSPWHDSARANASGAIYQLGLAHFI